MSVVQLAPAASDEAFLAEVVRIADEVAAVHAPAVDHDARFPAEAVEALRGARALSAYVPVGLGGDGVSFEALAHACFELGRRCSSTAMVFAMHQIQVVTLVRHLEPGSWFEGYLRRVAAEQRLIASITSEVGNGGDMSRSVAPVEDATRYVKQAPTVSYGAHADDYLATLRRGAEAEQTDQVAVLSLGEQTTLEPTGEWDTMGMRGTCSAGATVTASFAPEQVLDISFSRVMAESMVPVSHILWSHLWLGIATDAFDRARAFVRAAARRSPGTPPPAAKRLAELASKHALLRAEVANALDCFPADDDVAGRESLSTFKQILRYNNLKLAASEQAPEVCRDAMSVCGIMGYKNDTPFSVGRHLRDTMSGCLMVANDRLQQVNGSLLIAAKEV